MTVYMENPKGTTKLLPELITESSNVIGYEVNAQKLVTVPYKSNKQLERNFKK